jgi:cellulose synthase/poly-beta-1,6-N-acetylglucosamine synthase-like glycosyltransferase
VVDVPRPQGSDTLPYRQESVEVVVPVYNEEAALPESIPALCAYLETYFPYRWSVVIADNASTDNTLAVAEGLATAYHPHVSVMHLEEKGRGRALKAPGRARRRTSWPTWTWTSLPTCGRSCRWWRRSRPVTATWP